MIELIFIVVYLLSAFLTWKHINIAHNEGGIWEGQDTGRLELFLTFVPSLNTIYTVIFWIVAYPKEGKINFNKFFRIK